MGTANKVESLIVGSRLVELRKKRGLKISTILAHVGCARSTYTHYELGYRTPTLSKLQKLAEILETSTEYLQGLTDNELSNSSDEKTNLKRFLIENADKLNYEGMYLSEENKEKQIELLDSFLEVFFKNNKNTN